VYLLVIKDFQHRKSIPDESCTLSSSAEIQHKKWRHRTIISKKESLAPPAAQYIAIVGNILSQQQQTGLIRNLG
jgi:hypothetical protein